MSRLFVLVIIPLLLNAALGLDDLPRRHNTVSSFLDQILNQLSNGDVHIPDVDFRENGRISNLVGGVHYVSKEIDGYKSFGFKLNTTINALITGEYILNLNIPELFPIFGKGNLYIAAEEIYLNVLVDARYDLIKEKFDIDLPKFDVAVKETTVKLENLMNDPYLADFLSELISKLIPNLVTIYNNQLLEIAKPLISFYGNGILLCIKNEPFNIIGCVKKLKWPVFPPINITALSLN